MLIIFIVENVSVRKSEVTGVALLTQELCHM